MNLRAYVKYALAPILYKYPPAILHPAGIGVFLHEILVRREIRGDIAEIGCALGGTACIVARAAKFYSPDKCYTCFDTFSGFVNEQLDIDVKIGTPEGMRHTYTNNSQALVRRILDMHSCQDVRLVEGDITKIGDDRLSKEYSVILLDIDLSEPIYIALKRFYPRLSKGGIILVDDCREVPGQVWKASLGFKRFCKETGLEAEIRNGFGVVEK
jgi:O-methyltransferase